MRETADGAITFQVLDNGRGFEINQAPDLLGHGLSNMAERARVFGGEFSVDFKPWRGQSTITIRIDPKLPI